MEVATEINHRISHADETRDRLDQGPDEDSPDDCATNKQSLLFYQILEICKLRSSPTKKQSGSVVRHPTRCSRKLLMADMAEKIPNSQQMVDKE